MLEITGKNIQRNLHVIKKNESRLLKILQRDLESQLAKLNKTTLKTTKGDYEVYYEEQEDLNLVNKIINMKTTPIAKLSAYKNINAVEIVSKAESGHVRELIECLKTLTENISKPTTQH